MSYNRYPSAGGGSGGVTSVNGQTGVVVLTTSDIAEGSNLYFTNARAVSALSSTLTGYALLAGRAGGQTLNGGTAASENLTLHSTANGTKGLIAFGTSAYDEVNNRLGVGTAAPSYPLDVVASGSGGINVQTGDFVPWIGSNLGGANNMWLENYRAIRLDISNGSSFFQFYDDNFGTNAVQLIARHTRNLYLTTDGSSASKGVIVWGASGQTASMLQVQKNDGTVFLDVDANGYVSAPSTTGAFSPPRLTTTQKNALTPANGMIVYDSTLNKFQGYENGAWTSFI